MNSSPDARVKFPLGLNITNPNRTDNDAEAEAKQRVTLTDWLNTIIPNLSLPVKASDEELRACLADGTVLCRILNRLKPGSVNEAGDSESSSVSRSENVGRFLAAMDELGLPRFDISDLEKGSMKMVISCLLTLRAQFVAVGDNFIALSSPRGKSASPRWDPPSRSPTPTFGEDKQKFMPDSNFQRTSRSPYTSDSSAASMQHGGHKFHEVFQLKQGRYADLPAAKISEMMKSNSLDNAPTQSLLSVVNGILDESVEKKNGEIPHRVACLLRKVVQEIERRISTQSEHLRTQNKMFKAREEKYQSRIKVLEALASGASEEAQVVEDKIQHVNEQVIQIQQTTEQVNERVKTIDTSKLEELKKLEEDVVRLTKEKEQYNLQISELKKKLEDVKASHEQYCLQTETETKNAKANLEKRIEELECLLRDSSTKMNQLESHTTGSSTKVNDLESRLVDSSSKVNVLESRLVDSSSKVNVLESRLVDSSSKVNVLESRLVDSNTKVKELEFNLADSSSKVKNLESNLVDSSSKVKELESNLVDSSTKVKSLESNLVDSSTKVKELEYNLTDSNTKVKKLEFNLADSNTKVKELEGRLINTSTRVKELEAHSESINVTWRKKHDGFKRIMDSQIGVLQGLRTSLVFIKQELPKTQKCYSDEFNILGRKILALAEAAENYDSVLAENRKMFNELQDLKGNIRVYCRVRPFLPGQKKDGSIVDYIGDNGELTVANPSKPGKDGQKSFKFNKVYGPAATQVDVFSDTKPLIRSVLDGYNVCIFAYGQTGSGKTYTMMGPNGATEDNWGVNYRALNDLFNISQNRKRLFTYEVGVQMVEIYNEQVRDLLNEGPQKKLGIKSTSQAHGLAVPDASMQPVQSTADVMELMDIGLKNRAVSSTAMNERSSRSHSVVTVHVRGKDLKTGSGLHGNLHLVDLAGSERIDRSEVTGDRLKEAQHINKSLSALGDVIFALAQKSSHVPYRNSKLTQILQSSLGGQAKTLMFVQLNPDLISFSESLSTLKFAERVSGVELGAAKSSKEGKDGKDVKELMDQVASLKDTIAKKDDEIERLQLIKSASPRVNGERRGTGSPLRYASSSPKRDPNDSPKSVDDYKHQNESPRQSKVAGGVENIELGDGDYEESNSPLSDGTLSVGTDPDASQEINSRHLSGSKPTEQRERLKLVPKPLRSVTRPKELTTATREISKSPTGIKKSSSISSLNKPPTPTTPTGGGRRLWS